MEYVYAGMLLHSVKKPIDEASLAKVVEAAGVKADHAKAKALAAALKDVDIEKAIKSASVAPVAAAPAAEAAKPAEKKKEAKEEVKEEEAAEGLAGLFG